MPYGIAIVGLNGSGKSTLDSLVNVKCEVVELDGTLPISINLQIIKEKLENRF